MFIIPEWIGYRRGLDVSRWQGEIDFTTLQRGLPGFEFVAIRASIGDYYSDPMFRTYYAGFRSIGWAVGAYHVVDGTREIEGQLEKFQQTVGDSTFDFLVLDVEKKYGSKKDLRNRTFWMAKALQGWDVPVIMYTAEWYWSNPIGEHGASDDPPTGPALTESERYASGWPLWGADYEDNDADPFDFQVGVNPLPDGWKVSTNRKHHQGKYRGKWGVWQVLDKGKVPGIVSSVDQNYMTEELWQEIAGGQGVPLQGPSPVVASSLPSAQFPPAQQACGGRSSASCPGCRPAPSPYPPGFQHPQYPYPYPPPPWPTR